MLPLSGSMIGSALGQAPTSPLSRRKEERDEELEQDERLFFFFPLCLLWEHDGEGEEEGEDCSCNTTLWAKSHESDPEVGGVGCITWPNRAVICDCKAVNPTLMLTSIANWEASNSDINLLWSWDLTNVQSARSLY